MSLPALAAVAGLAAVAHLKQKGGSENLSEENKERMIYLVRMGRFSEARALAMELGLNQLDLSSANLTNADLTGAKLTYANLTDADLSGANLTNADLTGANLSYARLFNANLSNANLTGANLTGSFIEETIGINTGPDRVFVGIPKYHIEAKSPFVSGRTNLRRTR